MTRIGLSNYIDCKSTNGGDGDVVSCVGCEPGHKLRRESGLKLPITLRITYLIRQTGNNLNIGPTSAILPKNRNAPTAV